MAPAKTGLGKLLNLFSLGLGFFSLAFSFPYGLKQSGAHFLYCPPSQQIGQKRRTDLFVEREINVATSKELSGASPRGDESLQSHLLPRPQLWSSTGSGN